MLAEMDYSLRKEREIHEEFVKGGIDTAIRNLKKINYKDAIVLGLSVGGTIAWRYALENSTVNVYCIFSIRLRYELERPSCAIHLFYGSKVLCVPGNHWFEKVKLTPVLPKGTHII